MAASPFWGNGRFCLWGFSSVWPGPGGGDAGGLPEQAGKIPRQTVPLHQQAVFLRHLHHQAVGRPGGGQLFDALRIGFGKVVQIDGVHPAPLGGFTILRLTNLMGSMTEKKITKEMLLALNEQLNQIAKP